MNLQLVSWNVRGLNDGAKRLCVRNLLHTWKADIMCLHETKLDGIDRAMIRSLWRCRYVNWLCLDFMGASGGIIVMWDTRVVEKVEEAIGCFSVSCKFKVVSSGLVWGFSGVYGPHRAVERRLMWEELARVGAWWDVPWCMGGDFNTVRYPSERVGSSSFSPSMQEFSEFISSIGFIDLPLEGGSMTWSNCRSKS